MALKRSSEHKPQRHSMVHNADATSGASPRMKFCRGVDHQPRRGNGSSEGQEIAEGWPRFGPSTVHVRQPQLGAVQQLHCPDHGMNQSLSESSLCTYAKMPQARTGIDSSLTAERVKTTLPQMCRLTAWLEHGQIILRYDPLSPAFRAFPCGSKSKNAAFSERTIEGLGMMARQKSINRRVRYTRDSCAVCSSI